MDSFHPTIEERRLIVGKTAIPIRFYRFSTDPPFILLQLHSNETTAAAVAAEAAHRWGIPFLQIQNRQRRLISFLLGGKRFQFDPNRIFSNAGIKKTLQLSGRYSDVAHREVRRFSDSLLSMLTPLTPIVAVHNNTNGRLTIRQYRDAGIGPIHVNNEQDEDDFFITGDEEIFALLKAENFNVVLEKFSEVTDDGSLSKYCSRNNIRYINVEAQHGHLLEQAEMLNCVYRILNPKKN